MTKTLIDYEVTEARFILGAHRPVGALVQATERAAKYYVAPNGTGLIRAVDAAKKVAVLEDPSSSKATKKTVK
jgi:hypothetical protein